MVEAGVGFAEETIGMSNLAVQAVGSTRNAYHGHDHAHLR